MKVDGLAAAVKAELALYSKSVTEGIREKIKSVSKEMLENIRRDAPKNTGEYKKSMALKTLKNNANEFSVLWYVKGKRARIAHLLEYGHATANGGRARAFPHIKKNEEQANERLEKEIKDIIRKGV